MLEAPSAPSDPSSQRLLSAALPRVTVQAVPTRGPPPGLVVLLLSLLTMCTCVLRVTDLLWDGSGRRKPWVWNFLSVE